MIFLLAVRREAQALFASIRDATNRAAVASTARHVINFVLALSLSPARSVALAGVPLLAFALALHCTASSLRRLAREVGSSFPVELRLLLRLASRIIAATWRCLPMPTRIRPNPAFNADAPSAWLHTYSRMRASLRCCASRWRAG